MSKRTRFGAGLLSCLLPGLLAAAMAAAPQVEKGESWLRHGRRALEEYRAKNYPAFLENVERAARAYSLNGRTAEASKLLNDLAGMGLGVEAGGENFKPLQPTAGWAALFERLNAARAPVVRALPTTGVVVGDELFYVANTQIDRMGEGGRLKPDAKFRDPILLRLKLN